MAFPNVRLTRRPLHFIYLCDCSGSMRAHGKMQALNQALRQSLPGMAEQALDNPEAQILVRVLSFADRARWHLQSPTPVDQVLSQWTDLSAAGLTAMGDAMNQLAAVLRSPPMEQRALPPVLVLISDGAPTDDFSAGLKTLMAEPWAVKAVRLAIAIGHDADLEVLQQFIGPEPQGAEGVHGGDVDGDRLPGDPGQRSGRRPLQAHDSNTLARYIQWASTAVVGAASQPRSRPGGYSSDGNVVVPDLPPTLVDPVDVW
ncbi:MAG: VWA domain-containing protein [Synechococcaceae cyanobacterium]|nr:VWA domain-containing protein [Synechococcaceae cyanobacterium]